MKQKDIASLIENIDTMESSVRGASSMIYHSTPLTSYKDGNQLDIRDCLGVVLPATGRNCLVNGSTGLAKTHLAMAVMAGLFGSDYAILQIDPSLEQEKFFDIDGKLLQEGRLSEAIKDTPYITAPGVIYDETNRAPQAMLNILQAHLNNQAITPSGGKSRKCGISVDGKGQYQYKIGTCNEGKQYDDGTFAMDPAFRRRFPFEVPVNLFAPTETDREMRQRAGRTGTGLYVPETEGCLDSVLEIFSNLGLVGIDLVAKEFISYLGRMNQCIKSPFGTKDEAGFNIERCVGCHARGLGGETNICGNVYALPDATQMDLEAIAKGFALVRAHHKAAETGKMPSSLNVGLEDVIQVFPFVAATKMGIGPAWLIKHFKSGEPIEAAKAVCVNIEQRIKNKLLKVSALMAKADYTPDELAMMKSYCSEDPWAFGLRECDTKPLLPVVYKGLR
ncbi:MAG: MoxR family ATPase [Nanoarchaeota archaeon]|nr:MoxR family ATPase [Nanoarchaeota archaeon]